MSYLLLLLPATLALAIAFHLKHQFQSTAHIRQHLDEARNRRVLTGLHSLRKPK